MTIRLMVIAPGQQAGGANLLLARTAVHLARRHGLHLSLVDFEDGATRAAWLEEGITFEFSRYEVGGDIDIGCADVVMVSLLGAKLFPKRLKGNLNAMLLAWCAAPPDPFKFLPSAYFFNSWSWPAKRLSARWLFSAQRARIADFLIEGASRGGVVFMDMHCHEVNERLFGPGIPPTIVTICTGVPEQGPRIAPTRSGKAYWVGRITDFKTEPFIAMTRELLRSSSLIKEVVVIGDGADLVAAKKRLAGLAVTWLGYVQPENLDAELHAHAELVYGHGTALLEAAKLGVPSLLIDGSYERIAPDLLRAEWLYLCPVGYVGRISSADKLIGRRPEVCLAEFADNAEQLAVDCFGRWQGFHHPDAVSDRLAEVIAHGNYTVQNFLDSGAAGPGWFGSVIEWTKRNVFRRRY